MSFTESQEQILEATMQVIVRDGMDAASMRAVAEEADVSLGLLSYHFDDRENLIVAAFQLASERLVEFTVERLEAVGDDPIERAKAAARAFFDGEFLDSDYLALWIAIWGVSRTNDEVAAIEQDLHKRYNDLIAAELAPADPDASEETIQQRATDLGALQNGIWLHWARYANREVLERGLARCEALALGEI